MSVWQPFDDAPFDGKTEVILGWWETWPTLQWKQEIGVAGQMEGPRGRNWRHGRATHFMPTPNPPTTEGSKR